MTPPTEWRRGGGNDYLKVLDCGVIAKGKRKIVRFILFSYAVYCSETLLLMLERLCFIFVCYIKWFKCHLPVSLWLL